MLLRPNSTTALLATLMLFLVVLGCGDGDGDGTADLIAELEAAGLGKYLSRPVPAPVEDETGWQRYEYAPSDAGPVCLRWSALQALRSTRDDQQGRVLPRGGRRLLERSGLQCRADHQVDSGPDSSALDHQRLRSARDRRATIPTTAGMRSSYPTATAARSRATTSSTTRADGSTTEDWRISRRRST